MNLTVSATPIVMLLMTIKNSTKDNVEPLDTPLSWIKVLFFFCWFFVAIVDYNLKSFRVEKVKNEIE